MNRREAYEWFGTRNVRLVSYYKYVFTFAGDGIKLHLGGDMRDIYRLNIEADKTYSVAFLMEQACSIAIEEGNNLVYDDRWD